MLYKDWKLLYENLLNQISTSTLIQCGPKYRDSGIDTRIALIRDSDSDSDSGIDSGIDSRIGIGIRIAN